VVGGKIRGNKMLDPADDSEQHLPRQPDHHRHQVERQEVQRAVDGAGNHALRRIADAHRTQHIVAPADERRGLDGIERQIGLEPGVVHRHEHTRQRGDDDQHHHPLQVERVAHVRTGGRHRRRRIE
jgi:hypothetical protein